jgi:hypothetical protein
MERPYTKMNPPSEIFVVVISKFSPSCNKILGTLQFLRPHLDLRIIDADNPETRKTIIASNRVKSVPCIFLMVPSLNKVTRYENDEAVQLLNRAVQIVQQKQALVEQQQVKQKAVSNIKEVLQIKPTKKEDEFFDNGMEETKATISGRVGLPPIPRGEGHENMGNSSLTTVPRNAPEQIAARREDKNATILGTPLDDEDHGYNQDNNEGMSLADILGPQGGGNRESEQRSKDIKNIAAEMAKQRDTMN